MKLIRMYKRTFWEQTKQLICKGNNLWRNHRLSKKNIWLKTKTSKKLNNSFEEIEEFIILNWFKKKKSFRNPMERQLNYLIREQLHNINRSYPSKILSDKLADLIAKYLVCHAQDRRILHGITQAQIAYNYIIRILYVFIDNQQRNLSFSRNMIRTFNRPHRI